MFLSLCKGRLSYDHKEPCGLTYDHRYTSRMDEEETVALGIYERKLAQTRAARWKSSRRSLRLSEVG